MSYSDKLCVECGQEFTPANGKAKTCGVVCAKELKAEVERVRMSKPGAKELKAEVERVRWSKPGVKEHKAEVQRVRRSKPGVKEREAELQRVRMSNPVMKERKYEVQRKWLSTVEGKAKSKAQAHRRRDVAAGVPGDHVLDGEAYAVALSSGCFFCALPLDESLPYSDGGVVNGLSISLEHMRPLSRGGSGLVENLALSHLSCNIAAGNRMPCGEVAGANGMLIPKPVGVPI